MKRFHSGQKCTLAIASIFLALAGSSAPMHAASASPPPNGKKTAGAIAKRLSPPYLERLRKETDAWKLAPNADGLTGKKLQLAWDVPYIPQVTRRIKQVMGNDIEKFWDNRCNTNKLERSGDDLFATGGVVGLAGDLSFFDLNLKNGRCCVVYRDYEVAHVYGATRMQDLPKPVARYLEHLSESVNFEKPNWKPVPVVKATPVKKNLNLKCVTGTYERPSTRWSNGDLEVQALPGGKIKFLVFAGTGGQTGGTGATVPLVDNHAIYRLPPDEIGKDRPSYIELIFNGKTVEISGPDGAFCGSTVTLNGTYVKKDDSVPKFQD
jgi:hypothetical protein